MLFKKIFGAVHTSLKNEVFETFAIKEENDNTYTPPTFEEITFKIKEEEEKVKLLNSSVKTMIEEGKDLKVNNNDHNIVTYSSNTIQPKINHIDNMPKIDVIIPVDLKSNSIEEVTVLKESIENPYNVDNNNEPLQEDEIATVETQNIKPEPIAKFPALSIIGQYNKTYILGEYDGTLYMIDQHAAHEKILFEKYLKEIEMGTIIIQPLMVPSIIDLSIDDYSYYEENKDVFKAAGFLLEEFGGNSLSLKEVPYFLGRLNPKDLFLDILDNLKNLGNGKTIEVKHNAIATKACKAAIKANDKLDINEMVKLIEDLRYIDDPFHCPHGRPVIIKFTSTDIDKKFRRIV